MIDALPRAPQTSLKIGAVFTQVMQQTGGADEIAQTETSAKHRGQFRHLSQMARQRLPILLITLGDRMGVVHRHARTVPDTARVRNGTADLTVHTIV
jgi:hypothetical protein